MPQPRRLSPLDRVFLDLDTAETPQQVGWVIRFDGEPPSLTEFRAHVEPRLEHLPLFKMRIGRSRRKLGGPVWRPVEHFSIADHVESATADGDADLSALAGALLSRRLTRHKPLWRLWLVTGLDNGFAVIGHGHHTLIDGVAAVEVAMLLLDPLEDNETHRALEIRQSPSARAKARRRQRKGRLRRLVRGARMMVLRGPKTVLDDQGDGTRTIGLGAADLRTAKTTAREHGATPNDTLFAASSHALTAELRARGQALEWIKALMPFQLHADGRGRAAGNEISAVTIELPLGALPTQDLLELIAARTKEGKALGNAGVMAILARGAGFIPTPIRAAVTRWVYRRLGFSVIVSNLRGPPVEFGLLGRPATAIYPFVPLTQGQGLSIGAMSYNGRLWIGVNANAALIDGNVLAERIEHGFAQLADTKVAT